MQAQNTLHTEIKQKFPIFKDKTELQLYYMNYEYPDRQQKLFEMWKALLIFICQTQRRLSFSREELREMLVFYQMKPLPLDNVLRQLVKEGHVVEKSKYASQYSSNPKSKENEGFVSKVFGYFFSGKEETPLANQYFFVSLMDDTIVLAKKHFHKIFQGQTAVPESHFLRKLEEQLYLSRDAEFLLDVLLIKRVVYRGSCSMGNQLVSLIMYSDDPSKNTERYAEIFRVEYLLNQMQINVESKIDSKLQAIEKLLQKTKECMQNNNKGTAKQFIKLVEVEKEAMSKLILRKRILINQSNQLEESQSNIQMVQNLQRTNGVLESLTREVDIDKLIDLKSAADEIRQSSDEVQRLFQSMADSDMREENDLFRQLEREVQQEAITRNRNNFNVSSPIVIPLMEIEEVPSEGMSIISANQRPQQKMDLA